MAFPTDTHPAVGTQVTVDGGNEGSAGVVNLVNAMAQLADGGSVGVVAKGLVGSIARGYAYLSGTGSFQSDRLAQTLTVSALRQAATTGGEITFTVVPTATATRIGVGPRRRRLPRSRRARRRLGPRRPELSRRVPGDLKVAAKGRNVTWTMAPAVLPIRPIVVIDAPVAPSGQCADRPFAACAVTGGGRAIHCR